jgi:hypothetical protein
MSGIEDIQQLLRPRPLESLHKVAPVLCQVWQGGSRFESVTLPAYSFDTLDTLKQYIATKYKNQEKTVAARYLPKFLFVGIPMKAVTATTATAASGTVTVPTLDTRYLPLDYNWFSPGSSNPTRPISLPSPLQSLTKQIPEFTTRSGAFPALTSNPRGRTILEDAFSTGTVPTLHVFPLHTLLAAWTGVKPISESDWNSHFAAYFPTIPLEGPYTANEKDLKYGQTLYSLTEKRTKRLRILDERLDSGEPLPDVIVTGVQQLRLLLQKVKGQFDGCESLFYKTAVTDARPFLRLIPAASSAITKVLVKGVMPIPALEDPEVIVQWSKEGSPVVGSDILTVKYVHRPAMGTTCPIYGTIRILQDGTADLLLQPPERVKRLDPHGDFRNFGPILTEVLEGFPFSPAEFRLREAALQFQLIKDSAAAFLTRTALRKRLGFFTMFFQEIAPPERATFGQAPIIALRYKAVSQYATEDRIMAYITQYVTSKSVQGQGIDPKLLENLQEEFDLSEREAEQQFTKWIKDRDTVTLAVPEAGEFMESNNPGIDILVYRQPPNYHIEVQRIDSYSSFQMIFTLLGLLFSDEEDLFEVSEVAAATFVRQSAEVEREELEEEGSVLGAAKTAKPTAFSRTAVTATTVPGSIATASAIGAKATGTSLAAMEDLLEDEDEEEGEEGEEGKTFTPAPVASVASVAPVAPVASVTATKAATATATAKGKPAKPDVDEERVITPNNWLLNKLQQVDPSLFAYTAVPAGEKNYGRMCGAADARQPNVLDKQRLDDMMEEYEPEVAAGKVFFSLYPLGPEDDEYDPPASAQEITITRYGSDPMSENYYFCPLLFCLYDQKMVLEKDFAGTAWRPSVKKAGSKPPNTCPFCGGTEIAPNAKKPVPKATVYRRKKKSGGDKAHLHIGFMKKTTQPDGFALPCCFIPPKVLSIADKEYERFRTEARAEEVKKVLPDEDLKGEEGEEGEEEDDGEGSEGEAVATASVAGTALTGEVSRALKASQRSAIPYSVIFEKIAHPTTYILLAEKHPIDVPGKFAILPTPFDKYFGQNSDNIVLHDTIRRQVKSQSDGFIRIGTEIGRLESSCGTGAEPTEALFGVLAPLLLQHSIEEVRARILEKVEAVPQLFVSANFGNLVNEFYNPADPMELLSKDVRNMTDQTDSAAAVLHLKAWAAANLQIAIDDNLFAIRRIYNAYHRFKRFLKDKTQRKEIRHFSSFLAEPGILTYNGIQLIVLEWDVPKASEEAKEITVRCMPYGFSADRQARSDFAFVWKDTHGYYELLVYTHNEPKKGATVAKNDYAIRFAFENRGSWPPIVKQRIEEFTTQCVSNYRTVYTPQRGVDSLAMIPLSAAVTKVKSKPAGIVRDAYNHAVMLLFPMKPGRLVAASLLVALPIVDDGWMPTKLHLYLDVENFRPAPADLLINYYKTNFEDLFSLYDGYVIEHVVRLRSTRAICAVQLKNGLYVPASPPADAKALAAMGYKLVEVEKMEWTINTDLSKPCGSESELHNNQTTQKLEELYQQYRYIFSNWLASSAAGDGVRTTLQEVIFDKYPDYEKRKRLEIFLGSTLRSWLVPDAEVWDMPQTFLRKDCRVMDEAGCTGSCTWIASTGQCGLHVDAKATLGLDNKEPRIVSTPELFSRRLIDELIRFPNRRKELRTRSVSRLRPITSPLREGDQYIIPESSTTWINLLRMDWLQDQKEKPQFYEEMASYVQPKAIATASQLPGLEGVLGPNSYRLWNAKNLGDMLRIMGVKEAEIGLEGATELTPESIRQYVKTMNLSVGIVNLRDEPSITFVRSDKGAQDRALLIVKRPEGLGLLLETAGQAYVEVAKFPAALKAQWDTVARPTAPPKVGVLKRKAVSSLLKPATVVPVASVASAIPSESVAPAATTSATVPSQVPLSRVGNLFAATPKEESTTVAPVAPPVAPVAPPVASAATAAPAPPAVSAAPPTSAKAPLPSARLIRKAIEKKPSILSPVAEGSSEVASPAIAAAVPEAASVVAAIAAPTVPKVSISVPPVASVPPSTSVPVAAATSKVTGSVPPIAPAGATTATVPSVAKSSLPKASVPKTSVPKASVATTPALPPPPELPLSKAKSPPKAVSVPGKKPINLSAFDLSDEEGSNESPLDIGGNEEEAEAVAAPVSKKSVAASKKPAAATVATVATVASAKKSTAASKKPATKKNNNNNTPNYLKGLDD